MTAEQLIAKSVAAGEDAEIVSHPWSEELRDELAELSDDCAIGTSIRGVYGDEFWERAPRSWRVFLEYPGQR